LFQGEREERVDAQWDKMEMQGEPCALNWLYVSLCAFE
jgi:hypothetical protein